MIDSAVIVLPLPDSPTMPRHSPGSTVSDTPSMACTVARRSLDLGAQVLEWREAVPT